ncbi:unnamed protein product [Allacma fusca]|uniref:Endonuclease/exonuclease/phosphatase domain-containing protein n=1 Tax=Allacma fusca TaxID=39272 RepID=A0A8J2KCA6_9HEXA|nr:unnamed protein product [Allacma fusca]
MTTESSEAIAVDIVQGTLAEASKSECLKRAHQLTTQQTLGLARCVTLKVDAAYVITLNVDTADGLVNGATFYLRTIIYGMSKDGISRPHVLLGEFDDQRVGKSARIQARASQALTPIFVQKRVIYQWHRRGLTVVRIQFPVVPAAAVSVWKAQGGTYNNVVVHISNHMSRQLLYVAFIRIGSIRPTTLQGLFIDGNFTPPGKPSENDRFEVALERLRTKVPIIFNQFDVLGSEHSRNPVVFHNVQSFNLHRTDICSNLSYVQSDLLLLLEPKVTDEDACHIPNFEYVYRLNTPMHRRSPHGMLVFAKPHIVIENFLIWDRNYKNGKSPHSCIVALEMKNMTILLCYKSPKYPANLFLELLKYPLVKYLDRQILLVGDLNIDFHTQTSQKLKEMLTFYGLHSCVPEYSVSTQYNTLIDYCYSNVNHVYGDFFDTNFSYHYPLRIFLNEKLLSSEI